MLSSWQPFSPELFDRSRVSGAGSEISRFIGRKERYSTGISTFPTLTCAAPIYYLCSILDGFSGFLVHSDLRESMRETDVEVILQRAKEKYLEAKPRIISDNGPQFIARDFKEFRISGMTHVRTSTYYPQSNGKIERWDRSLKSECIRPGTPLSL